MHQGTTLTSIAAAIALAAAPASAFVVDIDLVGNAGTGLLPGNEVGTGANAGNSSASGGETGAGFSYDTDTNELDFSFEFSGLTGGLFDAAGGIHLHLATPGTDPQNETGGIIVFLNNGADPDVLLDTALVAIGATSGNLAGTATLTETEEAHLFDGRIYLNIHTGEFNGGELRANLVPEPATVITLFSAAGLALLRRRTA